MEKFVYLLLMLNTFGYSLSQNLSESIETTRLAFAEPLPRFDAFFKCKTEIEGSFASSYHLNEKTLNWIFAELNSSGTKDIYFHRDLYNDSSYLNYTIWRTFDGFPFNNSKIDFTSIEYNMTVPVTYSSYIEWEDRQLGIYVCEATPCGIGNWIYLERNCYHLGPNNFNQAYSWSQSRNYCKAVESDLLVVSNERELELILQLLEPFRLDTYVYVGYSYSTSSKKWEWINNFRSNISNFFDIEKLSSTNNNALFNVSALFKSGRSSNVTLRLISDSLDMIESEQFNALLTFVCKKSK